MDRALTVFIYVWVGLVVAANILGIGAQFYLLGLWDGLDWVVTIYSPWNVWNLAAEVVAFSPALGAYWWRERRRERRL